MTISSVSQWDGTTAANNVDLNDVPLGEGLTKGPHVNNAFRELMKQAKAGFATIESPTFISTDAGATAGPTLSLYRNSASPAASDDIGMISFEGEDSAGNTQTYARIGATITDTTSATEDGALYLSVVQNATITQKVSITTAAFNVANNILPTANDGASLGLSGQAFSDLFLASGAVINFDASDVTITHSTNALTIAGAGNGVTLDAFSTTGATAGWNSVGGLTRSSSTGTSSTEHRRFHNANGQVGSISTSGSATAYTTSSDQRLKENFRDFDGGEILDGINVYFFDWKAGGTGYGVKAQEAYEIFPDAIAPGGDDSPWSADYSKFVPLLIREVQALRARVAELENG